MERYELDYLKEMFKKHGEEFISLPNYKSDDFNLPCALYTLTVEIKRLKDGVF